MLSALISVGMKVWQWPPLVAGLIGLLVAGVALVGVILGIIGLAQYDRVRFEQGRKQATWGIVLCTLMIFAFVGGAVFGMVKAREGGIPSLGAAKREVVPGKNFAITAPAGWQKVNAAALGISEASSAFRNPAPDMYCVVLGEELGDATLLETYTNVVKQNLESASDVKERAEEDVTINGMQFHHMRTTARGKAINVELFYEHWLATHRGMFWQVIVWGPVHQQDAVKVASRQIVEKFEVLDRERRSTASGTFEDVDLPHYGVTTTLAGKGWLKGGAELNSNPLFRATAERLTEALLLLPLRFEEEAPDLEAVTAGMLATMDFSYPIKGQATEKEFDTPFGKGIEIETDRDTEAGVFTYVLRVIRAEKAAFFVAGWASKKSGDLKFLREALDNIELKEPTGAPPAATQQEKVALATVLNHAGLSYLRRQQSAPALKWIRSASALAPDDAHFHANVAFLLQEAGQEDEAFALLEREHVRFPKAYDLQTQRALLLAARGDVPTGQAHFLELIGRGLRDEGKLREWVNALVQAQRVDLAEEAVERWNEKLATPETQGLHIDVIVERGEMKRAIELAEKLVAENEGDHLMALKLGHLLNERGDYGRAGELAEKILSSKPEDGEALQVLGWSQMGRKAYNLAKATFERAAKSNPKNEDIAGAIQRASSALGQGQNSEVKQAIDPVPLPKAIAKEIEAASAEGLDIEGQPLLGLARSTGYRFEKGKPTRKTMRRSFKVLNQAGVNLVNTFEYAFNAITERIYV
ncbi:MAG: tetratricopeptide repeat protein, partial [Chthoniobacteraceae bacterium]